MPLTYITSNDNKLAEAEAVLNTSMNRQEIDLQEIQAVDLEPVARAKVTEAAAIVDPPVMISDTGLFFDGLNGFPGALIKWLYDRVGNEGICSMLPDDNRDARATTIIALDTGETILTAEGTIHGSAPKQPQGEKGFGWDPVFQPDGYDTTFAEMDQETKNTISMREDALTTLKDALKHTDAGWI